ncbi:MAG: hypothetical protein GXY05_11380 [Clostridiales bacterium]|nr:hypothetical protein [Clostridiales bacterium]
MINRDNSAMTVIRHAYNPADISDNRLEVAFAICATELFFKPELTFFDLEKDMAGGPVVIGGKGYNGRKMTFEMFGELITEMKGHGFDSFNIVAGLDDTDQERIIFSRMHGINSMALFLNARLTANDIRQRVNTILGSIKDYIKRLLRGASGKKDGRRRQPSTDVKPERVIGNKALEVKMVEALLNGESIIEKHFSRPKIKAGDIIGVQETWMLDEDGNILYMADNPPGIHTWHYAPKMPDKYVRMYVKVASVEKMTHSEFLKKYGRSLFYNRRFYYYSSCDKPDDTEWFRERRWESYHQPDTEVYAVTLELVT